MNRPSLRSFLIPAILCGLFALTACGESFDASFSPTEECWNFEDHLSMSRTVSTATVRPALRLEFHQDYAYTNLQLRMVCTSPSGTETSYDFQTTVLSATGDWLIEQAGSGYQVDITLAEEVECPEPGEYTFSLRHNMREDEICGIRFVGLRVPQ